MFGYQRISSVFWKISDIVQERVESLYSWLSLILAPGYSMSEKSLGVGRVVVKITEHPGFKAARPPHYWHENGVVYWRDHDKIYELETSRFSWRRQQLENQIRKAKRDFKKDERAKRVEVDGHAKLHDLTIAINDLLAYEIRKG